MRKQSHNMCRNENLCTQSDFDHIFIIKVTTHAFTCSCTMYYMVHENVFKATFISELYLEATYMHVNYGTVIVLLLTGIYIVNIDKSSGRLCYYCHLCFTIDIICKRGHVSFDFAAVLKHWQQHPSSMGVPLWLTSSSDSFKKLIISIAFESPSNTL